jgi:hypothetical protein
MAKAIEYIGQSIRQMNPTAKDNSGIEMVVHSNKILARACY